MRKSTISRKTKETDINVSINLDGTGESKISTGIGFFDHMLTAFAVHSSIDIDLSVKGDLQVDGHHTVEDTGIVLGLAFAQALGNKIGLTRYGTAFIPMDEALGFACVDISGRPYLVFNAEFEDSRTGDYDNCLTEEFWRAFSMNSLITLHTNVAYGKNDHHKNEAIFKAVAHAIKDALKISGDKVLSSKGVL